MCHAPSTSDGSCRLLNAPQSHPESSDNPESQLLPLKETSNVIVLARLQELRTMSAVNITLAMLTA